MTMNATRADLSNEAGTMGAGRLAWREVAMEKEAQANPEMDPGAINSLIQMAQNQYQQTLARNEAMNKWFGEYQRTGGGVDLSRFPMEWQKQLQGNWLYQAGPAPTGNLSGYVFPPTWKTRRNPDTGKIEVSDRVDPKTGVRQWGRPVMKGLAPPPDALNP
jgi:hypothetical protein